ncbi:MAG: RNA 2',3'-cyclic phosphodiesterase [Clostridia bacterium]|nr:RNA 2',3'-cyclic phosphodiesterase [Clostridia bacterium]
MRLFIAINFSGAFKAKITALQAELRQLPVAVKWVESENIHLTLKFLGEVKPERLATISEALKDACRGIGPLDVEAKGTGVFPNWRSPRVVWIGVSAGTPLLELQQRITVAFADLGFPADAFKPHITLGRLRPGVAAGPLQDKLQKLADMSWGREKVRAINLMESHLSHRGARYSPVTTVYLSG